MSIDHTDPLAVKHRAQMNKKIRFAARPRRRIPHSAETPPPSGDDAL